MGLTFFLYFRIEKFKQNPKGDRKWVNTTQKQSGKGH